MTKKDIKINPKIINRTDWAKELVQSVFLGSDKVDALDPFQVAIYKREKELECIRMLATFLTVDDLRLATFKKCGDHSITLETNQIDDLLIDRLKERQIDVAILPELLAVFPEFYHTVNGASGETFVETAFRVVKEMEEAETKPNISKLTMKKEYCMSEFAPPPKSINQDRYRFFGDTMVCNDKGQFLTGTYLNRDLKVMQYPLDTMKEKYPDAGWDQLDDEKAFNLACAYRDYDHLMQDFKHPEMLDTYSHIEHKPDAYIGLIASKCFVFGKNMAEFVEKVTIDDVEIHPRHYAYHVKLKTVVWIGFEILKGSWPKTIYRKDEPNCPTRDKVVLTGLGNKVFALDGDGIQGLTSMGNFYSDQLNFPSFERSLVNTVTHCQQPMDVEETVRGNGRQKIVDNGKHKWPAPKTRKGHH